MVILGAGEVKHCCYLHTPKIASTRSTITAAAEAPQAIRIVFRSEILQTKMILNENNFSYMTYGAETCIKSNTNR